ncbi:hypothetical protein C6988_09920 [Nitrosopumilus sp. b1]|uniref:hypothetical protein n=1 Tax=Nitrosopumilus sp. b1 TaxID=2109907 RepID=UPI0015F58A27|nr:hypothetical protein [Nitrosopumilus sp. b1]KAF6242111.1 hypothetical protein C6988_09920 [Nitrosopumilus sp. b1]
MPQDQGTRYGNLLSYKYYIRPTAHRLYGSSYTSKIKHHENVQKLLQILFINGTCTTWDMAKIRFHNDISTIRTKEKEFRRLLIGRTDRGKHSAGILELGLVVKDGKSYKKTPSDQYRLSLHGILFCLDVLNLSNTDIDKMAIQYSAVLPKIFGKWEYLKSIIGDDVYKLQILSKGLLLDNPNLIQDSKIPLYELMSFIHIKYRRNFESISEDDLANQISYWFYTYLLYTRKQKKTKIHPGVQKLHRVFERDEEIQKWFLEFFNEAQKYYSQRANALSSSGIA